MSIYLETDDEASLLIDASISYQVGEPLSTNASTTYSNASDVLVVDIILNDAVVGQTSLTLGSTDVEVPIDLADFGVSLDSQSVSIQATLNGVSTYQASTEFFKLPSPEGYGSVSRLDRLYGGLWVQRDNETWSHIFPYTYYGELI